MMEFFSIFYKKKLNCLAVGIDPAKNLAKKIILKI